MVPSGTSWCWYKIETLKNLEVIGREVAPHFALWLSSGPAPPNLAPPGGIRADSAGPAGRLTVAVCLA